MYTIYDSLNHFCLLIVVKFFYDVFCWILIENVSSVLSVSIEWPALSLFVLLFNRSIFSYYFHRSLFYSISFGIADITGTYIVSTYKPIKHVIITINEPNMHWTRVTQITENLHLLSIYCFIRFVEAAASTKRCENNDCRPKDNSLCKANAGEWNINTALHQLRNP